MVQGGQFLALAVRVGLGDFAAAAEGIVFVSGHTAQGVDHLEELSGSIVHVLGLGTAQRPLAVGVGLDDPDLPAAEVVLIPSHVAQGIGHRYRPTEFVVLVARLRGGKRSFAVRVGLGDFAAAAEGVVFVSGHAAQAIDDLDELSARVVHVLGDGGGQGANLQTAQALLRHSDPKLTARTYTKLGVTDLAGAVARVDLGVGPKAGEEAQGGARGGAMTISRPSLFALLFAPVFGLTWHELAQTNSFSTTAMTMIVFPQPFDMTRLGTLWHELAQVLGPERCSELGNRAAEARRPQTRSSTTTQGLPR